MFHNPLEADPAIAARIDALDIDFNEFGNDAYGVSKIHLTRFAAMLAWLYERYFKVEVFGLDNVPSTGRALLVGNHSGGVAIDGLMVMACMLLAAEPPRLVHSMAERFMHRFPMASQAMSRTGQFTGSPDQALRLLNDERLLLVFPEGARGTAKLAKDADSLVRFGTGFMRLALETKSPIVPFGFVGGGEALPTIANLGRIGAFVGVPYVPITKWIVPVPRRTRFQLLYGSPMLFEGSGYESDEAVAQKIDRVKGQIRDLIAKGRALREGEISEDDLAL